MQSFFFFFFWVTGELSTVCQLAKVPNKLSLRQNSGSEAMCPSHPQTGQAKRFGAMTTSRGLKAGHVTKTTLGRRTVFYDLSCNMDRATHIRALGTRHRTLFGALRRHPREFLVGPGVKPQLEVWRGPAWTWRVGGGDGWQFLEESPGVYVRFVLWGHREIVLYSIASCPVCLRLVSYGLHIVLWFLSLHLCNE